MSRFALSLATFLLPLACARTPPPAASLGPAAAIRFSQASSEVDAHDFVEVAVAVDRPTARNPFTAVAVSGRFQRAGETPTRVTGFCDTPDGSVHRIRFMPVDPGDYSYTVTYAEGAFTARHAGTFHARAAGRRGLVRVDAQHPFHFVWSGTGKHYFWNGTTTYGLVGWDDETIRKSIDRLAALKVNRIRVTLLWRVENGKAWDENVFPTERFSMTLAPWVAARPSDRERPGFDVTRFNLAHWQKYERLVRHARDRDIVVSVVFYTDGRRRGTDPFGKAGMGGPDEARYYRYAAARLSAFSNVMWDVTNEYHLFRDEPWADKMGAVLRQADPYGHLISVHGNDKFPFRKSPWADFAMYQSWDEMGGHEFMLANREQQIAAGRPMPQVNEEYGYEDHYPTRWGRGLKAPARSADNRRRLAWGIYMAGGYQTTGERADTGTGWGPDTGGGWINGRGDAAMTMLVGYGHIQTFFTSFAWWKTEPCRDQISDALCLADPGRQYALYLPAGREVTLPLEAGAYRARRFDPLTGTFADLGTVEGTRWTTPALPATQDWALLLQRTDR